MEKKINEFGKKIEAFVNNKERVSAIAKMLRAQARIYIAIADFIDRNPNALAILLGIVKTTIVAVACTIKTSVAAAACVLDAQLRNDIRSIETEMTEIEKEMTSEDEGGHTVPPDFVVAAAPKDMRYIVTHKNGWEYRNSLDETIGFFRKPVPAKPAKD